MTPDLNPDLKTDLKNVNLYLIGLMGAGKTTTGKLLAQALGYQFLDTDALIEQVAGKTIPEIFAQSGEPEFRQLETQVLAEVAAYRRLVVATGGGIVLNPMNWSFLHHGIVLWLNVPLETLASRLVGDRSRPLLSSNSAPAAEDLDSDPYVAKHAKLRALWQERQSLYRQADLEIAITAEQTSPQVVDNILAAIPSLLKQETAPPEPGSIQLVSLDGAGASESLN
jgi:shikimate kinase